MHELRTRRVLVVDNMSYHLLSVAKKDQAEVCIFKFNTYPGVGSFIRLTKLMISV